MGMPANATSMPRAAAAMPRQLGAVRDRTVQGTCSAPGSMPARTSTSASCASMIWGVAPRGIRTAEHRVGQPEQHDALATAPQRHRCIPQLA